MWCDGGGGGGGNGGNPAGGWWRSRCVSPAWVWPAGPFGCLRTRTRRRIASLVCAVGDVGAGWCLWLWFWWRVLVLRGARLSFVCFASLCACFGRYSVVCWWCVRQRLVAVAVVMMVVVLVSVPGHRFRVVEPGTAQVQQPQLCPAGHLQQVQHPQAWSWWRWRCVCAVAVAVAVGAVVVLLPAAAAAAVAAGCSWVNDCWRWPLCPSRPLPPTLSWSPPLRVSPL